MTGPRHIEGSSARPFLGGRPEFSLATTPGHRQSPSPPPFESQSSAFRFGIFYAISRPSKATQVFTSEMGSGGTGPLPITVSGNLRSPRSQGWGILSLPIGKIFSNRGSQRLISTQVSPVRTTSHPRNCLIICPSFAPSWQRCSSNRMPRRSNERQDRMPGHTVGSDGDKVTSWKS